MDYRNYHQTAEDRAAIEEYFRECREVKLGYAEGQESTSCQRPKAKLAPRDAFMVAVQFPRACTCCGLVVLTEAAWDALPLVGVQADDSETLELRNCPCGSTQALLTSDRNSTVVSL